MVIFYSCLIRVTRYHMDIKSNWVITRARSERVVGWSASSLGIDFRTLSQCRSAVRDPGAGKYLLSCGCGLRHLWRAVMGPTAARREARGGGREGARGRVREVARRAGHCPPRSVLIGARAGRRPHMNGPRSGSRAPLARAAPAACCLSPIAPFSASTNTCIYFV